MTKHILVLPDGTEISSGMPIGNVIQSVSITEAVNDAQVLSLGSTCASSAEINLITPSGEISIGAGVEITLYRENDAGERKKIGVFITEKPTRPTANTMRITAYDRITKLDKDLSQWLFNLPAWPYSLYSFATMVCEACGLQLVNEEIPHGDYLVKQFSAKGISGRKLMKWVGQICGRFCRATPDGDVEFAWYAPAGVSITPAGEFFYYENTLRLEDYQTYPIEKVQVHLTEDDVGAVWPDGEGEKNTYRVTGNYLLTADSTDTLQPIAETLYEQLKDVSYTPCSVTIASCDELQPGHIVQITDINGKSYTVYVMRKTRRGMRDTIECMGAYRLDSTSVFNEQTYEALSGKVLEVSLKMEGLSVKASDTEAEIQNLNTKITEESTSVLSNCNQILMTALQSYVQTSNYEQFRQTVESQVKLLRDEFSIKFEETDTRITEVDGELQEKFNQIATIFEFTINGFKIGKVGSPYKIFMDDNEFAMSVNDERVLWFELSENSQEANIPDLHIKKRLTILGYLIDEDEYGNVNCEYVGGE